MDQISATDNIVYAQGVSHHIAGNLKVQAVNLPGFVQQPQLADFAESLLPESKKGLGFKVPLLMRINRTLQVILMSLSALAILAYSLDVMMSNNLTVAQEKARRLSEQNCELSAKLLKLISFQGIQESVLGRSTKQSNLKVPEEVIVAAEVQPTKYARFVSAKHHLPIMAGY